jgi:protein-tyrosine phosphatase
VSLPAPRTAAGPYRVAFVCLGNICRSPMAHVVLAAKVADSPLAGRVEVDSSGTGDWHVGDGMDPRAARTLTSAGYDATRHRAQQFASTWFDRHDVIVALDSSNRRDVLAIARDDGARDRVRMLREFDPLADDDLDVPDPWYGGQRGFDDVLAMIDRSTDGLLGALEELLAPSTQAPEATG